MSKRRDRIQERVNWLLRHMCLPFGRGFIVAWNEDVVDAFVEEFSEAEKSLIVYTLGPNSSPLLNRTAKRAYDDGYIYPGSVGNTDARSFNQRTWARTWSLTDKGRRFVTENGWRVS